MATNARRRRIVDDRDEFDAIDWASFNVRDLYRWTFEEDKATRFAEYLKLIDTEPGVCPGRNGLACGQEMRVQESGNDRKFRMTQKEIMHEAHIGGEKTINDWQSFIRECYGVVLSNDNGGNSKIGGPGCVVEIDESHIRTRKYDVGRVLKSQQLWVFGGICRNDRRCFVVPVERRDAATLLPLIREHIEPGTHIVSDMWRVYRQIPSQLQGYTHDAVNQS
ncbi:hypothetical protein B4U79_10604, partial [Dinothrombium tinctorium]